MGPKLFSVVRMLSLDCEVSSFTKSINTTGESAGLSEDRKVSDLT